MQVDLIEEHVYGFTIRSGFYIDPELYDEPVEEVYKELKLRYTNVVIGKNDKTKPMSADENSFFIRTFFMFGQEYFYVLNGIGPLFNLPEKPN